jgi:hypothetical protein
VIVSGEQRLWEAELVRGAALAQLSAFRDAMAPIAEAFRRIGISAAEALERMRPAMEVIGRTASEVSEAQARGAIAAGRAFEQAFRPRPHHEAARHDDHEEDA